MTGPEPAHAATAGGAARPTSLQVHGVSKRFGGIQALTGVSVTLHRGSVLALVGENGAGKSTLLNIIAGVISPDEGGATLDGAPLAMGHAHQQLQAGIATVHQELTLFPHLTVWENVFAGHELHERWLRRLRRDAMIQRTRELFDRLGVAVDPERPVGTLPLAEQQLTEVAKALSWEPRVLILDEVTSALDSHQVERLFALVRELTADGVAVVFVSHRMAEVAAIADAAAVLKDGRLVATFDSLAGVTTDQLVERMVGRTLSAVFPDAAGSPGAAVLEVGDLETGRVHGLSLTVGQGEIVGLGGLQGHGQQETLRALFGAAPRRGGRVRLRGRELRLRDPAGAIDGGLAYLPADRKVEGLLLPHAVEVNLTLVLLRRLLARPGGGLRLGRERAVVDRTRRDLDIRQRCWRQPVVSLSGGNQQKVMLGKWLASPSVEVLLLDEPTRGVDVETKTEVYRLLRRLADGGTSILLASTDSIELVGLCDRVYVLYEGRVHRELAGSALNDAELTRATMGGVPAAPDPASPGPISPDSASPDPTASGPSGGR